MNEDRFKILADFDSSEVNIFFYKYKLKTVLVFGSVLTEEFNEESDVDIAVLGEGKFDLQEILDMELFFESYLNRKIDIVDLNSESLDIFIKINILNNGKSIYTVDNNKSLENLIEQVEWYYRENETFFSFRRRELLS